MAFLKLAFRSGCRKADVHWFDCMDSGIRKRGDVRLMKALIVDDEEHVRKAIRLLVPWDRFGVSMVMEASDGKEAISLISAERPEILFTDMMMPNMGGVELLRWTAEHAPGTKLIVISAHNDFDLVQNTVGNMHHRLYPEANRFRTDCVRHSYGDRQLDRRLQGIAIPAWSTKR